MKLPEDNENAPSARPVTQEEFNQLLMASKEWQTAINVLARHAYEEMQIYEISNLPGLVLSSVITLRKPGGGDALVIPINFVLEGKQNVSDDSE